MSSLFKNVEYDPEQMTASELREEVRALRMKLSDLQRFKSESARIEVALRESEEKFRALSENSNDCIMRFDRSYRHLYVNSVVEEHTGIAPEKFIGKTHAEMEFPQSLVILWENAIEKVFLTKKEQRLEFLLPTGVWLDWLLIPEFSRDGEVQTVLTSARDITERKNVELELDKERKLLQVFLENVPDHVYFKDVEGRFTRANKAQAKWLGVSDPVDLIGKTDADFFGPEHAEQARADELEIIRTGRPIVNKEERETHTDGHTTWVRTTKMPLYDQDKRVVGTFGVSRDITNRKSAEKALAESERRYRRLTENAPDIIWRTRLDGEITYVNNAVKPLLGYTPEEAVGLKGQAYLSPKALQILQGWITKAIQGSGHKDHYHGSLEYIRKDGDRITFDANIVFIRNAENRIVAIEGISRDITDRLEAENALRASEERYRALVESINDIIYKTDVNGRFTYANPVAVRVIGASNEDLRGRHFLDLIREDYKKQVGRFYKRQIKERTLSTYYEFPAVSQKGEDIWVGQNVQILQEGDEVIGFQAVARDITERKKAEDALASAYDQLEKRVEERTVELRRSNEKLLAEINQRRKAQTELQSSLSKYRKAMEGVIRAMALTVEMRDPYTAGHQTRVTELAVAIAQELGLDPDRIDGLRMAGIIHDLGKISIPAEILSKPGQLTDIVFDMIKIHPTVGYEILKSIDFPWPVAEIVRQHHERVNGSGYPRGLTGDEILVEAKILMVADVFEAVSSHRPYRPALGTSAALEEIMKNAGIHYDETVVEACRRVIVDRGFEFDFEEKKKSAENSSHMR